MEGVGGIVIWRQRPRKGAATGVCVKGSSVDSGAEAEDVTIAGVLEEVNRANLSMLLVGAVGKP